MGAKLSLVCLGVLALALALLRSSGGVAVGRDVTEMTFWNGFTGPDGRVMLGLVRQFNDTDGRANYTMQRIAWATYYNKLMVSTLDGRGPEVFVIHCGMLPRMHRAGFVESVNDIYQAHPSLESDYDPKLLEMVNYGTGGKRDLIGLPLDVHPQGLYCNAEMLKSIGFVNADGSPRPPANRDEFLKAAAAMKQDLSGTGESDLWGVALTMWNNNFMSLVPQFGGRYFDEHGEPTLDDPGNVQALQFLVDLVQKEKLAPSPEGGVAGWVGFRQKRVGMVFDGIYMLGDLKRLEGHPYLGAPMPQLGPYPGTFGDSHVLCIRKGLDSDRRQAAARFILFLLDHSLEWADAGQVPARRSVRDGAAFAQKQVQSAFAKQLDYVTYPPKTPSVSEFQLHINLAVESAIRNRATAAEALKQANTDLKRYLHRDKAEQDLVKGGT